MEFRSTNPEGFSHFGGDVMSGAHSTRGVLLSSNVVRAVSDNANEDLILRGKGTGGVKVNASTSIFGGINRGNSTIALVELPASGLIRSTLTVPGLGVNDMLVVHRSTVMSTALGLLDWTSTAADEATLSFLNNLASTQSIAANTTFKWFYIKST